MKKWEVYIEFPKDQETLIVTVYADNHKDAELEAIERCCGDGREYNVTMIKGVWE